MKEAIRAIYKAIPFKKAIFEILRRVFSFPYSVYQHLHFKGVFTAYLPDGTKFKLYADNLQFENELFWNGIEDCWERTSLPIWIELSKMADVIVDVGAQSGIFSIISRAINPKVEIYSFEPTERFFKHMTKSIEANKFEINTYKQAVSNQSGKNRVETVWQEDKIVSTTTLDDFTVDNQIDKIDLLKVDVDFHEVLVAEGYQKYFKIHQPTVLIEVLKDEVAQGIEKHWNTQELGYLVFSISEKAGTIRQMPDMSKRGDNMNFLLCKREVAKRLGLKFN